MKLEQLMEDVPFTLVQGTLETEIEDIIYDSRKAAPGLLFVCIVGTQRDSHDLAADCVAKGVNTLVIQHDIDLSAMPDVNVIKVESSRYAMAKMSANLFGNPSRQMTMIGVTGTKGKTTTTHMIKSVLEAAGKKVGMIGTNGIYFMGRHQETANTTPESYELQKTFRQFVDAGCDVALMEVSSQGLMMDRVAGIHYDVGVFTNLSPDHIGPINQQIKALCEERGLYYLDLNAEFSDENGYLLTDYAQPDGIHLTVSGYNKWVSYLCTHTPYSKNNPYQPGSTYYLSEEMQSQLADLP